jgi:hypothetical protein
MIADCALGLPGREGAKRPQLGNDGRGCLARARVRDLNRCTDREAPEEIFADVERQPLLPGRRDREHRLAGAHVLADLGDDHADDAVDGCPQDGLGQVPLEHRERGRRGLHLGIGDLSLLFRRPFRTSTALAGTFCPRTTGTSAS